MGAQFNYCSNEPMDKENEKYPFSLLVDESFNLNMIGVKNILVLESDIEKRKIIEKMFLIIDSKINLFWASNTITAIGSIENESNEGQGIDLVLVNLNVSGDLDGRDLRQYCELYLPKLKLILVGEVPLSDSAIFGKDSNMLGQSYLSNPFTLYDLACSIEQLFRNEIFVFRNSLQ